MGSFARTAGGVGVSVLAVTALAASPSAADSRRNVIVVPCDSTQLGSAVTQAMAAGTATIQLAPNCTYFTTTPLSFIGGDITLLGGPDTTIKANPVIPPGPLLNIGANATFHVQGIILLGGNNVTNGGAISNAGRLTLRFVTITGNATAGSGGGVYNTGGALIANSVVKANTATSFGGGVANEFGGVMTIIRSVIAGNNAGSQSGGVDTDTGASTRIIQSTIEKNTATDGGGGLTNAGRTFFDRSLVQYNKGNLANPASGGGIFNFNSSTSVTLRHTIVRFNSPNNCTPTIPGCLG